jgi:hypothetical protein
MFSMSSTLTNPFHIHTAKKQESLLVETIAPSLHQFVDAKNGGDTKPSNARASLF